jgi:hypothetical protein
LLLQLFITNVKPSLQKYFEPKVDIFKPFSSASEQKLFLKTHLSPDYRVTTGEIIDRAGNLTGKLGYGFINDDAPFLTFDSIDLIIAPILAEAIFCFFEVKIDFTIQSLKTH